MKEEVEKIIDILKKGGTILYPTDTIWGIGCDAKNEKAIQKIYNLKKRKLEKNLIILVDSERRLQDIVDVPALAWDLIDLSEKPITIIYDNPKNISEILIAKDNTIAIRLTKDSFCKQLINKLNSPIVSTSANLSGEKPQTSLESINEEIKNNVDYIVNLPLNSNGNKESSIIKLSSNGKIKIIRE